MRRIRPLYFVVLAFILALACASPASAASTPTSPVLDPLSLAPDPTVVALAAQSNSTGGAWAINASSSVHGTIAPSGIVWVSQGASQTFTLAPDSCFVVYDLVVDGNSVGPRSNYTFANVASLHTIYASFGPLYLGIMASAGTGGSISPGGLVSVACGADTTFTVTPGSCYRIDDVVVDGVSQGPVASFTFHGVQTSHTIAARFVIAVQYPIAASAGAGGTIAPAGNVLVNCGANQLFTITPAPCCHIVDVVVDGVSQGVRTSVAFTSVHAAHTVAARFAADTYTIVASAIGFGTITPSGTMAADCGSSQTFTLTPDSCAHVDYLLVDGNYVAETASYTFNDIHASHTIIVNFTEPRMVVGSTMCGPTQGTLLIASDPLPPNTSYGVDVRAGCALPAQGAALTYAGVVQTNAAGSITGSTLPCYDLGTYTVILDLAGTHQFNPGCDAYTCCTVGQATATRGIEQVEASLGPDGPVLSWWVNDRFTYSGFRVHRAQDGGDESLVTPEPVTLPAGGAPVHIIWRDASAVSGTRCAYRIEALTASGADWYGPYTLSIPALPQQHALRCATVNPTRGTARLAVDVPPGTDVPRLDVYDVAGRHVRALARGALAPGQHLVDWDGLDDGGARVRGGVYMVRLQGGRAACVAHIVRLD